uniref:DUF7470 family protein n=1 Tax=Halorubrum amylolyticum TaxID=2508724 RepID=UPI001008B17D|nr:hypothetical protein [Halorubrum amylolyticum]
MRDTLGSEGIAGVAVVLIAVGILTVHDPIVGAGVMILSAGLALIAKGIADSTIGRSGSSSRHAARLGRLRGCAFAALPKE